MTSNHEAGVRLAELPTFDCWQLLETAEIARFAWNGPRGVAMVPVNYTVADGALWFRTTPYAEHAREAGGQWVAVEVDSLDPVDRSGWSVVVRGVAELIDPADVPDAPRRLSGLAARDSEPARPGRAGRGQRSAPAPGHGRRPGQSLRCLVAKIAAWVRLSRPSLARIAET